MEKTIIKPNVCFFANLTAVFFLWKKGKWYRKLNILSFFYIFWCPFLRNGILARPLSSLLWSQVNLTLLIDLKQNKVANWLVPWQWGRGVVKSILGYKWLVLINRWVLSDWLLDLSIKCSGRRPETSFNKSCHLIGQPLRWAWPRMNLLNPARHFRQNTKVKGKTGNSRNWLGN